MASHLSFIVLAILVPGLGLGIYLLVSGLRGRRVGDEPRCAKCGYILLHLQSLHCPECGGEIGLGNTVVGQRVRRHWRAVVGAVLLLILCMPLVGPVRSAVVNYPWYQLKPAGWVLADLDQPPTYQRAMAELARREKAGSLSAETRTELIEMALQEQAGHWPAAFTKARQELLEFLGESLVDGRATEEQKSRFLDQACALSMTVRPIVAEGDQVPFRVTNENRGPQGASPKSFWMSHQQGNCRIDGQVVQNGTMTSRGGLSGGSTSSSAPAGGPGKHTLEADHAMAIWCGTNLLESSSVLLGRRNTTTSANYEVLPREQAPKIQMLDSAELCQQVRAAISVERLERSKNGHLMANLRLSNAPCDLAFDVLIVAGGVETNVGSIHCAKGQTTMYGTGGDTPELPGRVKVVLRPSERAARNTIDLAAMFAGEIVFEDVEVRQTP